MLDVDVVLRASDTGGGGPRARVGGGGAGGKDQGEARESRTGRNVPKTRKGCSRKTPWLRTKIEKIQSNHHETKDSFHPIPSTGSIYWVSIYNKMHAVRAGQPVGRKGYSPRDIRERLASGFYRDITDTSIFPKTPADAGKKNDYWVSPTGRSPSAS